VVNVLITITRVYTCNYVHSTFKYLKHLNINACKQIYLSITHALFVIYHSNDKYIAAYHSNDMYTTVYHSNDMYTTVYHRNDMYTTVYHSNDMYTTVSIN